MAIIGSRDQFCTNPELSDCSGADKVKRCHALVENSQCKYFNQLHKKMDEVINVYSRPKVLDIEEWFKEGTGEKFCPFYANRSLVPNAKLVILPFDQLLDTKIFCLLEPYLSHSVVIIEDADLFEAAALKVDTT